MFLGWLWPGIIEQIAMKFMHTCGDPIINISPSMIKMRHCQPPGAALVLDILCAAFETCKSEVVTVQIQNQVLRA